MAALFAALFAIPIASGLPPPPLDDGAFTSDPPVVVVQTAPMPQPAPIHMPSPAPEREANGTSMGGGELSLSFGRSALYTGDSVFSGSGRPPGASVDRSVNARGVDVGLVRPRILEGSLGISYLRRYLAVGARFTFGGGSELDATPRRQDLAGLLGPSDLRAYGAALDVMAVVPIEPLTFRAGLTGGVRYVQLPIVGFESTTCTSKGHTYACPEQASAVAPYGVPTASIDIAIGKSPIAIGAIVSNDVFHGGGDWSWAFSLIVRTPHWELAP